MKRTPPQQEEKEKKVRPLPSRPPVLDVCRHIRELDVIWYHHSCWACVKWTDCSAKLIDVGMHWREATAINADGNGIRVCSTSLVGADGGPNGPSANDKSVNWLVGRLSQSQILRSERILSPNNGRTVLGVVEVPMPGFAPRAPKRRRSVEVESVADDSTTPAPLDPVLGALQSAAEEFGRVLVSAPVDEVSQSAATELSDAPATGEPSP